MANASQKGTTHREEHRVSRETKPTIGQGKESPKNEIQELHAKEVGVGNPSEERANS